MRHNGLWEGEPIENLEYTRCLLATLMIRRRMEGEPLPLICIGSGEGGGTTDVKCKVAAVVGEYVKSRGLGQWRGARYVQP